MKVEKKSYYHRSSVENTLAQMPRYNAYACGHGEHQTKRKPNRAKQKENLRKEIRDLFLDNRQSNTATTEDRK